MDTTTVKNKTAEAAAPILAAFHAVEDRRLGAVRQFYTEGSLDKIVLEFGQISLVIAADEDDDSIDIVAKQSAELKKTAAAVNGSRSEPWISFIGKPFGWGWLLVNQQGYCDGLLLSFEVVVPQIVNVIASALRVGTTSICNL